MPLSSVEAIASSSLVSVFDLASAASGLEIIPFLVDEEAKRDSLELSTIHVCILPDSDGNSNSGSKSLGDDPTFNELIGCMGLLDSIRGFTLACSRREASMLIASLPKPVAASCDDIAVNDFSNADTPKDFVKSDGRQATNIAQIRASKTATAYVDRWIEHVAAGRPLVSITVDVDRSMSQAPWPD